MQFILAFIVFVIFLAAIVPRLYKAEIKTHHKQPTRKFGPPYEAEVSASEFKEMVVNTSKHIPVLVDFYAPWCGPCEDLAPVLSGIAKAYKGSFLLAKVNVDESHNISYVYGVQAMPTVVLFYKGKELDRFQGVQTGNAVRQFLLNHGITQTVVQLKSVK